MPALSIIPLSAKASCPVLKLRTPSSNASNPNPIYIYKQNIFQTKQCPASCCYRPPSLRSIVGSIHVIILANIADLIPELVELSSIITTDRPHTLP